MSTTPGDLSLGTAGVIILGGFAALALAIAIAVGHDARRSANLAPPVAGPLSSPVAGAPAQTLPISDAELPLDTDPH